MQYGLFLKGIGLTLQQSLTFWRKEFTKRMDPETVSIWLHQSLINHVICSLIRATRIIYVTIMARRDVVLIILHLVIIGLLLVTLHQLVITMVTTFNEEHVMTNYNTRVSIPSLGCWLIEEQVKIIRINT